MPFTAVIVNLHDVSHFRGLLHPEPNRIVSLQLSVQWGSYPSKVWTGGPVTPGETANKAPARG